MYGQIKEKICMFIAFYPWCFFNQRTNNSLNVWLEKINKSLPLISKKFLSFINFSSNLSNFFLFLSIPFLHLPIPFLHLLILFLLQLCIIWTNNKRVTILGT